MEGGSGGVEMKKNGGGVMGKNKDGNNNDIYDAAAADVDLDNNNNNNNDDDDDDAKRYRRLFYHSLRLLPFKKWVREYCLGSMNHLMVSMLLVVQGKTSVQELATVFSESTFFKCKSSTYVLCITPESLAQAQEATGFYLKDAEALLNWCGIRRFGAPLGALDVDFVITRHRCSRLVQPSFFLIVRNVSYYGAGRRENVWFFSDDSKVPFLLRSVYPAVGLDLLHRAFPNHPMLVDGARVDSVSMKEKLAPHFEKATAVVAAPFQSIWGAFLKNISEFFRRSGGLSEVAQIMFNPTCLLVEDGSGSGDTAQWIYLFDRDPLDVKLEPYYVLCVS